MNTPDFDIIDLLLRHISDELREDEQLLLEEWAAASEGNRRLLEDLDNDEVFDRQWRRFNEHDPKASWKEFRTRLPRVQAVQRLRRRWTIAAICVLLIGIGIKGLILLFSHDSVTPLTVKVQSDTSLRKATAVEAMRYLTVAYANSPAIVLDDAMNGKVFPLGPMNFLLAGTTLYLDYQTNFPLLPKGNAFFKLTAPPGRNYDIVLPDGTRTRLNATAAISFAGDYGIRDRTIALKGEASFDVDPMALSILPPVLPAPPFTVKVDPPAGLRRYFPGHSGMTITAWGTRFNVRAKPKEAGIRALLFAGKIVIGLPGSHPRYIFPGQACVLGRRGDVRVLPMNRLSTVTSWRDNEFVFEDEPVENILQELGRWYNVQIVYLEKPIGVFLVSGPRNKPITYLLDQMKAAHHFNYTLSADTVYVSH